MKEEYILFFISILMMIAIIGFFILIGESNRKEEERVKTIYQELCQDSQFYYGHNHAEKCYQYGVKPK